MIKLRYLLLAAVLPLSGCFSGDSSDCSVVFLGDSVADDMAEKVESRSDRLGYQFAVNNLGVRGAGLIYQSKIKGKVSKIKEGNYVVISAGANDTLDRRGARKIQDGTYEVNLSALVKSVIDQGGKPILLEYEIGRNRFFDKNKNDLINNNLNEIIREVAQKFDVPFISTAGLRRYDGVHLHKEGVSGVMGRVWTGTAMSADQACRLDG